MNTTIVHYIELISETLEIANKYKSENKKIATELKKKNIILYKVSTRSNLKSN